MKSSRVVGLFIILFVFSLQAHAAELKVAAAANLQSVLVELIDTFMKRNEGIDVKTIMGSSGKLTAQIENGAPFDVFLSADMKYPQTLYEEGLSLQEPKIYAYGVLVLWTTKDLDLSESVKVLTNPSIKKVAIANPQSAPYGKEAVNAMKFYQVYGAMHKKLVYGESISQANDFIVSQAADIGFTSKSTVISPNLKEKGKWIEVPSESYNRIAQGCVILKHAKKENLESAHKFYDFLFSSQAKDIFKKYGYTIDE